MIEPVAGSVVRRFISVVCERRQDGRQRIGVADVEGGSAFGGAFNKTNGTRSSCRPRRSRSAK